MEIKSDKKRNSNGKKNCLMYSLSKIGNFPTFTFIFRVLQYRRISPENQSYIPPRNFSRRGTTWWSLNAEWKLRAGARNFNIYITMGNALVDYAHMEYIDCKHFKS